MKKQKFKKGNFVRVAKDLGPYMSHFENDCNAIVISSYADKYPHIDKNNITDYTIYLEGKGETSWYYENQLTLIEKSRLDLLNKWEKESQKINEIRSNLDWIFSHGVEVYKNMYGASIKTLASCFGFDNLWGSHGEGYVYYDNATKVLSISAFYIDKGKKEEWLLDCEKVKNGTSWKTILKKFN